MASRLSNYLRTHRKRAGFTQEEVAFLLGVQSGAKVCRYERFVRQPTLDTVFAYEVIFRRPARDLFKGIFQQVERQVQGRAAFLIRSQSVMKPSRVNLRKLDALRAITQSHES